MTAAQAVVTGAASGIGRALATQLAAEGVQVHLADLSPTEEVAQELRGIPHKVDVAIPEDMERLAAIAPDAATICLNAGMVGGSLGLPWEVPQGEWLRLVSVNVLGVVNGLRAFVPRMLSTERPGHIIITASLAGLVTFPGGGAYAATKHAVVAIAEQAALALADTPLSVTVLCPALVKTAMSDIGADPADVAASALRAAREDQFLVMPAEWQRSLLTRAERLVSGDQPTMPAPMEGS